MATEGWSRGDRIAMLSLLVGVVACAAALIVVPEARQWLGLDSGRQQAERQAAQQTTPTPEPARASGSTQRVSSRESSDVSRDVTAVEQFDFDGITVKYNSSHQIVAMMNLSGEGELCYERPTPVSGSIVKLEYDDEGIQMAGFILEDEDGRRTTVNLDTDVLYNRLPIAVSSNLSSLFAKGNRVSATVVACGASGRVLMAKNIRAT